VTAEPNTAASGDTAAFVRAMGAVARELLGTPTEESKEELRFGKRGSLCVDLTKGTYFDNETGKGGGLIAFVRERKGLDKEGALGWLQDRGHLPKREAPARKWGKQVAVYDYRKPDGTLLFQVVRFEPKDFRQRRPDASAPSGWTWKTKGLQICLYRLPEVTAAIKAGRRIYLVEGEKSADALAKVGLPATCSPGGAGKWKWHYAEALAGADVAILPDNDPQATTPEGEPRWHPDGRPVLPGQDHAADVARGLAGTAAKVGFIWLPGLPSKGDVVDWLASGGSAEALEAMEASEPPPEPEPQDANDAEDKEGAASSAAPPPDQVDYEPGIRALVDRFNKMFMVVNEAGKAVIFQPGYDAALKRRRFDRLSLRDLNTLYMNETIPVGVDAKKRVVFKPVAEVWLHHRDRRQFIHGVTFDPTAGDQPGILNLWEGYAFKPAPGDWSLLRQHVERVICDGDPVRFNYLMSWMARMLQHPAEQGEVAVVMKGGEGTGKGTLAKVLMKIMGHHGLAISNSKHLIGNFNAHLRDVIFLFADEALFAGDRAHVGVLKSLITEPYLTVEGKFQNAVQMPNFLHVMMASNEEWVVPASQDARRFFVLEVPDRVKGDHAYFGEIWKQMDSGGYAALLHDLLAMDLTCFNVRAVPSTEGLQRQKKLSLPTVDAWWLDCLARGYVFRSKLGLEKELSTWLSPITTELLFASYIEFAKGRNERRILSREELGRFLTGLDAAPRRMRNAIVGEHIADVAGAWGDTTRKAETVKADRPTGYSFGTLTDARTQFTTKTGLDVAWDDGTDPADDAE
jgi:hypothetical protein